MVSRELNVIKPNDRHIFRYTQIRIAEGTQSANCRHIIECDYGSKLLSTTKQILHDRIA